MSNIESKNAAGVAFVAGLQEIQFSENAERLYALIERDGKASFSSALRKLGMPYGDVGRASCELIVAGMVERTGAPDFAMVLAGGVK